LTQFNKLHVYFNNFYLQSPSFADPALNQRGAAPALWFSKPQYSELRHGCSQSPNLPKVKVTHAEGQHHT